jgi:hypothetical protein
VSEDGGRRKGGDRAHEEPQGRAHDQSLPGLVIAGKYFEWQFEQTA